MSAFTMALFGNPSGAAALGANRPGNLVEFRAGKMYMKGKMVHPDKRKGLVYVYQSDEALMHFCWKDRTTGTVEEDLIIFPDDVEFKAVPQCTTGRVFLLKFKNSSRKLFFWMQEPKKDKDEDYCKKVNDYLNDIQPPTRGGRGGRDAHSMSDTLSLLAGGGGAGGLSADSLGNLSDNELQGVLRRMDQNQLLQLLGYSGGGRLGAGGGGGRQPALQHLSSTGRTSAPAATATASTTPAATTTAASASTTTSSATASRPATATSTVPTAGSGGTQFQLADLQGILSTMVSPGGSASGGGGSQAGQEGMDLGAALSPEVMAPILADPGIQEQLRSHLPPGLDISPDELRNTVNSPQFQQAMAGFSAALQSGQVGPLMAQFNLGDEVTAAAAAGDMDRFLRAMQAAHGQPAEPGKPTETGETKKDDKKEGKDSSKDKKDKDDDDAMALD